LDARITRIFNTYGPKMNVNEGRAVVNFIKQSINNENITIYGKGTQTRSFCFINDQIDGQILAMEKGKAGQIFNIGNPDEITILEFAKKIKGLTQSASKIIFSQDLPIDDPVQRKPDITKAKNILGWVPNTQLEEGLIKTIKYFREIL
ncbi:MAG: NAD-dependent dehydratase, partial [Candidatus Portnoybacteria bacterium CG10_big_fil_rev_8_21_14_0_10_36_7]